MSTVRENSLDLSKISDSALRAVGEKVASNTRLSHADAELLFTSPDLLGVGMMADYANRRKHGDVVTFAANQHINPTNVCYLRKTCVFCSFARLPKEDGAYHYTLDQVFAEAESAANGLTKEFHIVGGLDMKAGLQYYSDMFRGLKERHPQVHIKALTAVEIAHISRIDKISIEEVLTRLREAGLDTLPGGGAEVFGKGVRMTIADKKLAAEDWIDVHRTAHRLGIRSNCTMLYGHVESIADRVEHLSMLRDPTASSPIFRWPTILTTTSWESSSDGREPQRQASTICAISPSAVSSSTTSSTSRRTGSWSRRFSRRPRSRSA